MMHGQTKLKLTENSLSPTKETPKAAGFDLRSAYDIVIAAGGKESIKTDLEIKRTSVL
jgi:dUTP pyrophosphatase